MSRHVLRVAYDGHTFRSKTEAQWARCFELLGLAYQYEPTVVRLERGHGRVAHYKPDFYLPSLGCWLEIKNEGTKAPDLVAAWKAHRLAVVLGEPVYVFFGPPMGRRNLACGNAYRYAPTTGAVTRGHQFTQCPRCATPAITPYGLVGGVDCACADKLNFSNASSVAIVDAETSARGYAFRTLGH